MDGPWYETESPSRDDVKRNVLNKKFWIGLKDNNSSLLKEVIKQLLPKLDCYDITCEKIKKDNNWEERCLNILNDEIEQVYPFGSWRGYSTFVEGPLYKNFVKRVLYELGEFEKVE